MKFKIKRDAFSFALAKVQNVADVRNKTAVLNNALLRTTEDNKGLILETTNGDRAIRCELEASVEQPGSITLPVRTLTTIVRALPHPEVDVHVSEKYQTKIHSGSARYRLMGMSAEDFPSFSVLTNPQTATMDQGTFLTMLRSVSHAQSLDENRHILNGIYCAFEDDQCRLVATDGRRLSMIVQNFSAQAKNGAKGSFILPSRTAAELEKLLSTGGKVRIDFTNQHVIFEVEAQEALKKVGLRSSVILRSKLIEGNYPDYRQVIPKEVSHHVKIDRELFLECLNRAALVTTDKSISVKLRLANNTLEVSASSAELGESQESMAVEFKDSGLPATELAFNPQFLIEPLRAIQKDEVTFEFKDALSPGMLKTTDAFLSVVMPLRSDY